MSKILFNEEQRFTQWWLWLLLIGIGIIPLLGIYNQLILGKEFGSNPMSNLGIIIFSGITYLIIGLFSLIKLKIEISETECKLKFFPFLSKTINWNEVVSAAVVNYGFVGGWGIRKWTSYGTVYNIKGKMGLAIVLKDGSKFLIGTQKEKDLKSIIKKITL
jgi:hypothetical protein